MVIVAIEESTDLSQLSIEQLMGSLLTHETIINISTNSLENALQSQTSINRGRERGNKSRVRRGRGQGRS